MKDAQASMTCTPERVSACHATIPPLSRSRDPQVMFVVARVHYLHCAVRVGRRLNVRCCSKVFNTELYMEDKTMTAVAEYMTRDPVFISVRESLQHAADLMNNLNVGVLPVCDGNELVGMLTDRDIVVHALARGESGSLTVEEIASEAAYICHDDDDVTDVRHAPQSRVIRLEQTRSGRMPPTLDSCFAS
jgi:hypothetical protein